MDQRRGDRRIDAARQAEDHLVAADLRADRRDRLADVVAHVPVVAAAADLVREAREDRRALLRVRDLGMELHARRSARDSSAIAGDRARVDDADQLEAGRQRR